MNRIKFALISMMVLVGVMFQGHCVWALTTLSLQPSTNTPTVGTSFDVAVNIASVTDLYAFQFDIQFDPSVLSATLVTEGSFLASGGTTIFDPGTIDNVAGSISFIFNTLIGSLPGVSGDGLLVTLSFFAIAAGSSDLNIVNEFLVDSSLGDISAETVSASIRAVAPGGTVPEPSSLLLIASGLAAIAVGRKLTVCAV